jgi:putative hydrolase of the HAD superfamily
MNDIQAVLFDLGDTLSRSASLSQAIENLVDSPIAQKLRLEREQLRRIGLEIDQYIRTLYREERWDQPDWRQVWACGAENAGINISFDEVELLCRAHLKEFTKRCKLEPYSIPLMMRIQAANIPLGLVSNVTGPADIFERDLSEKGLARYFSVVVWSANVGYRKPNPRIFEIALEGLKLKPGKQILMVGDNEQADIVGGKKMGFTTVKVDDRREKSESAADYVVLRSELQELFEDKLIKQRYLLNKAGKGGC